LRDKDTQEVAKPAPEFGASSATVRGLEVALHEERMELVTEIRTLRAQVAELQHALDLERHKKEAFQRYANTIETMVASIASAAKQAHAAAMMAAQQDAQGVKGPGFSVEAEVRGLVDQLRPRTSSTQSANSRGDAGNAGAP